MCGIMGYVGRRDALPILLDGLRRLEYRGYDSAGVAVFGDGRIEVRKAAGKLSRLEEAVGAARLGGTVGIGHTRWATHGIPTDANAHPHADCTGRVVVIHNGIIENFFTLKEQLAARGHIFRSDTDTEVLAHLIEEELLGEQGTGNGERLRLRPLEDAVRRAIGQARGAYAVVVMSADQPDRIVDLANRLVTVGGQPVQLTPTEYELLKALVTATGKVLTHHQLLRQVWGRGYEAESHMLRVNVSNLRHKIEPDQARPTYILTESGIGYRLRVE